MEVIDFESDNTNFKIGFEELTRYYGYAYKELCQIMWHINETMTEEEFCQMNGNMPKGFFENVIKKTSVKAHIDEIQIGLILK